MFGAKYIEKRTFSTFFVNSKFDILKVTPNIIHILWWIKGLIWFIIFYGLTVVEHMRILQEVFQKNLIIALLTTYFSIVFFAKKIANRAFSQFFVSSKLDIRKVILKKISIVWRIKGWLEFTNSYSLNVVEQKGILRKFFSTKLQKRAILSYFKLLQSNWVLRLKT